MENTPQHSERKLITDEYLNDEFEIEGSRHHTFPTSSNPQKKCYYWRVCEYFIVSSDPDDRYSIDINFWPSSDEDTIREIREVKYIDDLEDILRVLSREPEEPVK